jgi:hypothetical protein
LSGFSVWEPSVSSGFSAIFTSFSRSHSENIVKKPFPSCDFLSHACRLCACCAGSVSMNSDGPVPFEVSWTKEVDVPGHPWREGYDCKRLRNSHLDVNLMILVKVNFSLNGITLPESDINSVMNLEEFLVLQLNFSQQQSTSVDPKEFLLYFAKPFPTEMIVYAK